MAKNEAELLTTGIQVLPTHQALPSMRSALSAALGPIAGILIWLTPLGLDPIAQKALAIVAFMIVYWITEPIDHAITAIIGCYLFWVLNVARFSLAFSGFVSTTPWFLLGALLMGQAASRAGLAKRLAYIVILKVGTSYPRLLLGVITLVFFLNFLIPSGMARLAVIAPILVGMIAVFGLQPGSNVAKGLFIILTYTCGLFDKMILAGATSILAQGIIEEQTGVRLLWSQWLVAYLPATLATIFASWFIIQRLYPAETKALLGGKEHLQRSLREMGSWTMGEKKVLVWLLLAVVLWAMDFVHQISPAAIAISVGLLLVVPKVGFLNAKSVMQINFLPVVFSAGALSMGNVIVDTKVLNVLTEDLSAWVAPLLSDPFHSTFILYWGGFFYHFLLANEQSMLSTSLPVLLQLADTLGYNPIVPGLIWTFASSGRLFVYQSSVLVLGYSYGYFRGSDLLKVGAVLTVVEWILLAALVPFYWPLIGLTWK
jgi:anion transporter